MTPIVIKWLTHVENLAAFAARFLTCVRPFFGDCHPRRGFAIRGCVSQGNSNQQLSQTFPSGYCSKVTVKKVQ